MWEVKFGRNTEKVCVVAKNIDEAIAKARKARAEEIKSESDFYWISGVSFVAESDI